MNTQCNFTPPTSTPRMKEEYGDEAVYENHFDFEEPTTLHNQMGSKGFPWQQNLTANDLKTPVRVTRIEDTIDDLNPLKISTTR